MTFHTVDFPQLGHMLIKQFTRVFSRTEMLYTFFGTPGISTK